VELYIDQKGKKGKGSGHAFRKGEIGSVILRQSSLGDLRPTRKAKKKRKRPLELQHWTFVSKSSHQAKENVVKAGKKQRMMPVPLKPPKHGGGVAGPLKQKNKRLIEPARKHKEGSHRRTECEEKIPEKKMPTLGPGKWKEKRIDHHKRSSRALSSEKNAVALRITPDLSKRAEKNRRLPISKLLITI